MHGLLAFIQGFWYTIGMLICAITQCSREVLRQNLCPSHYNMKCNGTLINQFIQQVCWCGTKVVRGDDGCVDHRTRLGNGATDRSVGYRGMHVRLNTLRGKASQHDCVECGGQAQEWALLPGAGTHTEFRNGRQYYYSLNVDDYVPLCCKDHRIMDLRNDETSY